ncbi:MAG: hypothetical protein L6Q72_05890 [Burkholderiaceae bacterium]|nr:hypothetical protein [Burkholderiaceae bacterium]
MCAATSAAAPATRLFPESPQVLQLGLAVDERRQRRGAQRLEPVAHRAFADDLPGLYRLVEALQAVPAEILVLEDAAGEPARRLGHDDCARPRQRLQPGGQIQRAADGRNAGVHAERRELRRAVRHVADDHHTGRNPDVHLRARPRRLGCRERESRPDRALRIVFVGARVAEVREQPVADILRHDAAMAHDETAAALSVRLHDLGQFLRVEPLRQRRPAHQIAQHHAELAAFGRLRVVHGAAASSASARSSMSK